MPTGMATLAEASDRSEKNGSCRPFQKSLDVTVTFTLSGKNVDEPSHSTRTSSWNQSSTVRGTLFSKYADGVYNIEYPGSKANGSGALTQKWKEVYKKTDVTGEGGSQGGSYDPRSMLRVVVEDDDGTCRFMVSAAPRFTGVQRTEKYTDQPAKNSTGGDGFGSFQVNGELDSTWSGSARASGTIPTSTTTLTIGKDELNGPGGSEVTAEVIIGEKTLPPSAELVVEHLDVPSLKDWVEVPKSGTFEGNVVRLTARVDNPSEESTAVISIRETTQDQTIAAPIRVAVAPGENEYQWELDTEGFTWDDRGERAKALDLRLVVDIYGHNLADEQTLPVKPRPVALVHGWNSNAGAWRGYADTLRSKDADWEIHAVGDGAFEGEMETGSIANPFDRGLGLVDNAKQLDTYIESMRDELDAQRVDLVSHSMGGLMSRYYVAAVMPIPNGMPVATRLLMLGTPNLGSPCASIIPHRSAFDLDPDVVKQFNEVVRGTNGVRFAILAGDAWPTTCHVPGEGDMVVPVTSAFGLPYVTDQQRTSTDHVAMTRSASDAKSFVLPRLTRPAAAPAKHAKPLTSRSPRVDVDPNAPSLVLAAGVVEVAGGKMVDIPISVDKLDEIGAVISAQEGTSVELLRSPEATAPARETASAAAASATTSSDQFLASTEPIAMPEAGSWTLRLSAAGSATTPVAYAVVGRGASAPSITVKPGADELIVTADRPGATVDASLLGPKGQTTELAVTMDQSNARVALPANSGGSTVVVSANAAGWKRVVHYAVVDPAAFKVPDREKQTRRLLVTPPTAVAAGKPTKQDAAQPSDQAPGKGGFPIVGVSVAAVIFIGAIGLVIRRRSSSAA